MPAQPGATLIKPTTFKGYSVHEHGSASTDQNFFIGGTQDNGTGNLLSSGLHGDRIGYSDGGFTDIDQNSTDTVNMTMLITPT